MWSAFVLLYRGEEHVATRVNRNDFMPAQFQYFTGTGQQRSYAGKYYHNILITFHTINSNVNFSSRTWDHTSHFITLSHTTQPRHARVALVLHALTYLTIKFFVPRTPSLSEYQLLQNVHN